MNVPFSWYATAQERWQAARDLHALGAKAWQLLAEVVEHQTVKRPRSNVVLERLYDQGFLFVSENFWDRGVQITSSVFGEEALLLIEEIGMPKKLPALTDLQFEILRTAVTLARTERIKTADRLKTRLRTRWPKHPQSVTAALNHWSSTQT